VSGGLRRSRKSGVFTPRLADTAAESGASAREFGEKGADTGGKRRETRGGPCRSAIIAGWGLPYGRDRHPRASNRMVCTPAQTIRRDSCRNPRKSQSNKGKQFVISQLSLVALNWDTLGVIFSDKHIVRASNLHEEEANTKWKKGVGR
jgi:hypothetical protein